MDQALYTSKLICPKLLKLWHSGNTRGFSTCHRAISEKEFIRDPMTIRNEAKLPIAAPDRGFVFVHGKCAAFSSAPRTNTRFPVLRFRGPATFSV